MQTFSGWPKNRLLHPMAGNTHSRTLCSIRLQGHWKLFGTIRGKNVEHSVEAQWVLNHQFLQVHEKDVAYASCLRGQYHDRV